MKIVLEEGYSRMPVYRDTIDNIIGIVYTKDLLGLIEYRNLIMLQDIIRPAYFVPETKKISQLMRELQQQQIHMAVVIDEFGGTEGIITMEDILEEIVGEIHDEYDEELRDIEQTADGSFLVNARMSIAESQRAVRRGTSRGGGLRNGLRVPQQARRPDPGRERGDRLRPADVFDRQEEPAAHQARADPPGRRRRLNMASLRLLHCLTHSSLGGGQELVLTLAGALRSRAPEVELAVVLPAGGPYVERFRATRRGGP